VHAKRLEETKERFLLVASIGLLALSDPFPTPSGENGSKYGIPETITNDEPSEPLKRPFYERWRPLFEPSLRVNPRDLRRSATRHTQVELQQPQVIVDDRRSQ
jgi:hypothetical protein